MVYYVRELEPSNRGSRKKNATTPNYRLVQFWPEMNDNELLKEFTAKSDSQALWVAKQMFFALARKSDSWSAGDLVMHVKKYNPKTRRYRRIYVLVTDGEHGVRIFDEIKQRDL